MKKIFYFSFPVMLLPSLFTWFRWDSPAVAVTGLEYFVERWMGVAAAVLIYYVSGIPSLQKDAEASDFQSIGMFRPSPDRIEQSFAHFLLLLSWIRAYFSACPTRLLPATMKESRSSFGCKGLQSLYIGLFLSSFPRDSLKAKY